MGKQGVCIGLVGESEGAAPVSGGSGWRFPCASLGCETFERGPPSAAVDLCAQLVTRAAHVPLMRCPLGVH